MVLDDGTFVLPNGQRLIPHVTEFTARLPTRKNGGKGGNRLARLRYAKAGVSPRTNLPYVVGHEVGDRTCRHTRTVWADEITVVHRGKTEEHPLDLPKPRARRGR